MFRHADRGHLTGQMARGTTIVSSVAGVTARPRFLANQELERERSQDGEATGQRKQQQHPGTHAPSLGLVPADYSLIGLFAPRGPTVR